MYLGKLDESGLMSLVEIENGKEVNGNKLEEDLRNEGYKNVCLIEKSSETALEEWLEFEDCFIQTWREEEKYEN